MRDTGRNFGYVTPSGTPDASSRVREPSSVRLHYVMPGPHSVDLIGACAYELN